MTESLPFKALPELSGLLDKLQRVLDEELQNYQNSKDSKHFQQILNALGYDLSEYTKSIDAWHTLSLPPEQYDQVQTIELKIDKARHSLTKAIGTLNKA